ncbi:hypothetical protein GEMRC1_007907 [Eukaryota sp. GEM-RC1]
MLLSGGCAEIPELRREIYNEFKILEPQCNVKQNTAAASGACLIAAGRFSGQQKFTVSEITTSSLLKSKSIAKKPSVPRSLPFPARKLNFSPSSDVLNKEKDQLTSWLATHDPTQSCIGIKLGNYNSMAALYKPKTTSQRSDDVEMITLNYGENSLSTTVSFDSTGALLVNLYLLTIQSTLSFTVSSLY